MIRTGVLNLALKELNKSQCNRYKVGAVVFKSSKILSSGHNSIRTCSMIRPKFKQWKESLHAEQAAIIQLDWSKTKNTSILILRCNNKKNSTLSLARPCKICMDLIKHIGMKDLYYSNRQGEIVKEKI